MRRLLPTYAEQQKHATSSVCRELIRPILCLCNCQKTSFHHAFGFIAARPITSAPISDISEKPLASTLCNEYELAGVQETKESNSSRPKSGFPKKFP